MQTPEVMWLGIAGALRPESLKLPFEWWNLMLPKGWSSTLKSEDKCQGDKAAKI